MTRPMLGSTLYDVCSANLTEYMVAGICPKGIFTTFIIVKLNKL